MKGFETVEYNGIRYAEILWASATAEETKFFSPADSSFQFGLLAHGKGFVEPAHFHKKLARPIDDLQQMFVVQRGVVAVDFFASDGTKLREVILKAGDAIVLVHGTHAIRVIEDMQCVTVKQGPFMGVMNDKIEIKAKDKK